MWRTRLAGQMGLQKAAPKLHESAPVWVNLDLSPSEVDWCILWSVSLSTYLMTNLPLFWQCCQISESWDNTVELWGLVEGRAHRLKSTWVQCFQRQAACLSGLQRVPSWFSSIQSVITVAGWRHYSMCISQHSQCFPCVVSFLLYPDSQKLRALQKQMKTVHWHLIQFLTLYLLPLGLKHNQCFHMVLFNHWLSYTQWVKSIS